MRPGAPYRGVRFAGPPGWRILPPVTRATLALCVAGYLLGLVAPAVHGFLVAEPHAVFPGLELWRLLTYPLVLQGIWNLLFGLLLFWALGSDLEPTWGSRGYALFLAASTLLAGVLGTAAARVLRGGLTAGFGISGLLAATIVAWALVSPSQPVSFFGVLPMSRRGFAILSLVVLVFGELEATRSAVRLVFLLGGLPVAWAWTRRNRPGGTRLFARGGLRSRLFGRRHIRVVRHDDRERFH